MVGCLTGVFWTVRPLTCQTPSEDRSVRDKVTDVDANDHIINADHIS